MQKIREISYLDGIAHTLDKMAHGGVFLSVGGARPNTMTIGWGWIGYCWKKNVFAVVVRPQRFTYAPLIEQGAFTVSVPTVNSLRSELAFAGSHSGRDVDKFSGHGLTALPARAVSAPIIAECGLHFECRTLLTQDMTPDRMDAAVTDACYPQRDFHTMFFGEILSCYRTDGL